MAEKIQALKPLGDRGEVKRKINKRVSRKLNRKSDALNVMPMGMVKGLRMLFLILLIPASVFIGIVDGLCKGFMAGLEAMTSLYRKELNDASWFK